MKFPVNKHCDCFQYGVRIMNGQWNGALVYSSYITDNSQKATTGI